MPATRVDGAPNARAANRLPLQRPGMRAFEAERWRSALRFDVRGLEPLHPVLGQTG
jgi:hypothetical protein